MLFKKLFIATLSILALAGCSDNDTIHEIVDTEKGDVIVTFAASGANQVTTKADDDVAKTGYVKVHANYEPTDQVKEYCWMVPVDDKEFVINHMTVLVFDANGALVKTAFFNKEKDIAKDNAGLEGNSISQFGGIVLKEGDYNFILAGNLTDKDFVDKGESYDYYKEKAFIVGDKLCDTAGETTHLPMVKFLEKITLTAHKVTASATLNVLYQSEDKNLVQIPNEESPQVELDLPEGAKPVYLERLVARVQLRSIAYDWKQDGAETFKMKVLGAALVNAAEKTFIGKDNGDGSEGGFLHGSFTDELTGWYNPGESNEDNSSMVAYEGEIKDYYTKYLENVVLGNGNGNTKKWGETETEILPISFYTYAKSGVPDKKNPNYELMLVIKCQLEGEGNEPVYYYVPLRDKEATAGTLAAVKANTIYNVSVTLKGDGSDIPGKKKDTVEPEITISTENWEGYHVIEGDGVPAQQ